MPFNMNFTKDALEGSSPAPDGWYQLILKGFNPVYTRDKTSFNFQPVL